MISNSKTNIDLIQSLIECRVLKSERLINAMHKINRKNFVTAMEKVNAYCNYPLPIGYGQTISQPQTVAFILELLDVKQGDNILEVGSGSGWSTALLAYLTGQIGKVHGVEIISKLVDFGRKNLEQYNLSWASIEKAGKDYGLAKYAPYDKILVSAAAKDIPESLFKQLKIGGKMVIPVGKELVSLVKKSTTDAEIKSFKGFTFVPLIKAR